MGNPESPRGRRSFGGTGSQGVSGTKRESDVLIDTGGGTSGEQGGGSRRPVTHTTNITTEQTTLSLPGEVYLPQTNRHETLLTSTEEPHWGGLFLQFYPDLVGDVRPPS